MSFDIGAVRAQFPSLGERDDGKPRVYLIIPPGPRCHAGWSIG